MGQLEVDVILGYICNLPQQERERLWDKMPVVL